MKRYYTTDKNGEEVEVTREVAKQLISMGKKSASDFTIEEDVEQKSSAPEKQKQAEPKEQPGTAERITGSLFPRTLEAAKRGEEFPLISGIADAASLPGRAVAAGLGTFAAGSDIGFKGIGAEMASRMAQTRSNADFLPTRIAEDVVRDPLLLIAPGVSSVVGKLGAMAVPAGRAAMGVREAAKVGAEAATGGAIYGNDEGGGFSVPAAVMGAVPGSALGVKAALDVPANAAIMRELDRPQIVEAMMGVMKPGTPTFRKANPVLNDRGTFEKIMFKGDEYSGPAFGAVQQGSFPWEDVLGSLESRVENIGAKQASARNAPEFQNLVAIDDALRGIATKPSREYSAGDILRSDLSAKELNMKMPFGDVLDRLVNRQSQDGSPLDQAVVDDVYKMFSGKSEYGELPGSVTISDLIDLKRELNAKRKKLGGFKTPETSDAADAYASAYNEVNNIIKSSLPETQATADYRKAEREFAESIPMRDAAEMRIKGVLGTNMPREQTELGRIGIALENAGSGDVGRVARDIGKAFTKNLPPKVDVRNAQRLYDQSPEMLGRAMAELKMGGTRQGVASVNRVLPYLTDTAYRNTKSDSYRNETEWERMNRENRK